MRRGNSGGVRNVQSVVPVLWSVLIALSALQHSHAFPPSASPSASPTAFPPASSLNRRPFSLSKMHITTAEELLSGLEQKAQDGQPVCGVALDIDETLAWTGKYWLEQMQVLFGNPENLSPEDMFKKYKLCQHVPYYASNPEAMKWMSERRSCDTTQRNLPIIQGSVEGVASLQKHVTVVAYLTVRPHKLAEGTAWWLKEMGFPEATLVCKPDEVPFEQGNAWKAKVLGTLYPYIRGMVDDNPSVLNSFVPEPTASADASVVHGYPGTFFLFGHDEEEAKQLLQKLGERTAAAKEAGKTVEMKEVVVCPTWPDVVTHVTSRAQELSRT